MLISPSTEPALSKAKFDIKRCFYFEGDQESWHHPHTMRPWNSLYYVTSGDGFIKSENEVIDLKAGHMYLMPLNRTIGLGCHSEIKKFFIDFSITLESGQDLFHQMKTTMDLGTFSEKALGLARPNPPYNAHPQLLNTLCLFDALTSPKLTSYIQEVFIKEQTIMSRHSQVFKYLQNHLSASLKISDIAKALQITAPSLSRSFKKEMGYNLKDLIQLKINQKAQTLLISSQMNVQEIAYDLGFEYPDYFCRFFKRNNACSPKEYRQSRQKEGKFFLNDTVSMSPS